MKKHDEVVAAVIGRDNKVLCCQRGNKGECAYKWEFPGGKIETGETREEALKREIKEELNFTIKIKEFITMLLNNPEYKKLVLGMFMKIIYDDLKKEN